MKLLLTLVLLITLVLHAKAQPDSSSSIKISGSGQSTEISGSGQSTEISGSGQSTVCGTGDLQLVNGTSASNGRVEVCIDNAYGTVCDDHWSVSDARVVCKQLRLPWKGALAYSSAQFGQGSGPIVLGNISCNGSEESILECDYDPNPSDCTHLENAGVVCAETSTPTSTPIPSIGSTVLSTTTSRVHQTTDLSASASSAKPSSTSVSPPSTHSSVATASSQSSSAASSIVLITTSTSTSSISTSTTSSIFSSSLVHKSTSKVLSSQSTSPTPIPGIPGEVQNLVAIPINDSAVNITWNYPVNSTGLSEYDLIVQYRSGDIVKMDSVPAIRNLTYYIINNLDPYIPYTISIVAFNINNGIGPSTSKDFFVKEGKPLFAPANVVVVRINSTAINVSWDPVPVESARGFIVQYSVTYQLLDGSDPITISVDSSTVFVIVSGLRIGEQYGAKVTGITSAGEGPTSPISYEDGARPPLSSGSDAGFIAAGAFVILGVAVVVLVIVIIAVVLFKRVIKKKYIYDTSTAVETDQELLQYSDKNIFNASDGGETSTDLPDKVKKVHEQSWDSSTDIPGESRGGTYTKFEDEPSIESEIFEL